MLGAALRSVLCREATEPYSMKSLLEELQASITGESRHREPLFPSYGSDKDSHLAQMLKISKLLRTPPYHSFHLLPIYEGFGEGEVRIVPPDTKTELGPGQWYEHGALREWHNRRRRKMWSTTPEIQQHIDEYETTNRHIRPSYLPPLADLDDASTSCSTSIEQHDTIMSEPDLVTDQHEDKTGQKRKYTHFIQDNPQELAYLSSNKKPHLTQDMPHCSPSGRVLPDPDEIYTDINNRVVATSGFDWGIPPPSYQQTNRYNRIWE